MLLPPGRYVDSSEYIFNSCPSCLKDSHFYWNIDKNVGGCHSCGYTISGYHRMVRVCEGLEEVYIAPSFGAKYRYLRERGETHYTNAWDIDEAREFLTSRNISEKMAREVPFNWCDQDRTMSVRITAVSDEFPECYLYRYMMPKAKFLFPRGLQAKYYGFNLEQFQGTGKSVLLCEGITDLCSSGMLDFGVAMLGSSLHDSWLTWLERNCGKIAVWLDADEPGWAASEKISHKLNVAGLEHKVFYGEKDPKNYRFWIDEDKEFLLGILEYLE